MNIEPRYRQMLESARLTDFDVIMRFPGGSPAGRHRHRETVPVDIVFDGQGRRFFLKRVFRVPPKHAFWPLFRGRLGRSQPYREWHVLGELAAESIPAMTRVAMGERRHLGMPRQAFLLVEAVPMEYTLEYWLVPGFPKPPLTRWLRGRLVCELGGLMGRLHRGGFRWLDVHAKHVFAAPAAEGRRRPTWRFCLIDVERMTRRPKTASPSAASDGLPDDRAMTDLRQLYDSLRPMPLPRHDVSRFLVGYCPRTPNRARRLTAAFGMRFKMICGLDAPPAIHRRDGGATKVREGAVGSTPENQGPRRLPARATNARGDPHRPAKPPATFVNSVECGPFVRLPDDYEHPRSVPFEQHNDLVVDERSWPLLVEAKLGGVDAFVAYEDGLSMSKPGLERHRQRMCMAIADREGHTRIYYLKRYLRPSLKEQFRRIWSSRAKRGTAWRESHFIRRLGEIGVPTARLVGWGGRMVGVWERCSFSLTEQIEGQSLEELCKRAGARPAAEPSLGWSDRREIIRQLALLTAMLHRNELYHRDLYLCHVFLTRNADGGIVLRLIDLARMLERPRCAGRWRIKDLAALDYSAPSPLISRADRIRFLCQYLAATKQTPSDARQLISAVRRRVRRMARHDARRAARQGGQIGA